MDPDVNVSYKITCSDKIFKKIYLALKSLLRHLYADFREDCYVFVEAWL